VRRMISTILAALVVTLLCGVAFADQPAAADSKAKPSEGQAVFAKYKCTSCHSIDAAGIKKKPVEGDEAETEGVKPPDLSGVGVARDAAWMTKFLSKEEKIEGKVHPKKFRGTPSELQKVTAWLATMKDEAAAKKMKENEHAAAKTGAAEGAAKTEETKEGDAKGGK
jgi:cytochrome c